MNEKILCAAIWYRDLELKKTFDSNVLPVNCDRGLVFCGFRHAHCLYSMCSITGLKSTTFEVGEYTQGFLTNKNRFVDRDEGLEIAFDAGQLKDLDKSREGQLFSEDLY